MWTYTRAAAQAWNGYGYARRICAAILGETAPSQDARPLISVAARLPFVEGVATTLVELGYSRGRRRYHQRRMTDTFVQSFGLGGRGFIASAPLYIGRVSMPSKRRVLPSGGGLALFDASDVVMPSIDPAGHRV